MNKVLDIVQQHVQWLVVGIAALFLGWTLWAFVIAPDWATTEKNGRQLSGGEIDRETVVGPVAQLQQKMGTPGTPKIPVPTGLADNYGAKLAGKTSVDDELKLASGWALVPEAVAVPVNPRENVSELPQTLEPVLRPLPPNVRIARLPESLIAPEVIGVTSGLSAVEDPAAVGQGFQPGQAPSIEKNWASAGFKIDMAAVAKSFADVNVPPVAQTMFLKVEMQRQEQKSDGSWSDATTVPYLMVSPAAIARPNYPPAGGVPPNRLAQLQAVYVDWAKNSQPEILQPLFYMVVGGLKWELPGAEDLGIAAGGPGGRPAGPFDPNAWLDTNPLPAWMTPEERGQVARAKAQRDRENRPPPGPRGGGRRGGGGGEGGFAMQEGPRPPRGGYPPNRGGPGAPGAYSGEFTGEGGGEFGEGMPVPGDGRPDFGPLLQVPNGPFEFGQYTQIVGWAHDETVVSGKTYRYRVKYSLLSPVYGMTRNANPASIAQRLDIDSNWSEWSSPVTSQGTSAFFISGNFAAGASGVRVDLFKWDQGAWMTKSVTVGLGDVVGGADAGVDFSTGWLLADIRQDSTTNQIYAEFVNASGQTMRRTFTADNANDQFKQLKDLVSEQAGAAATPR